MEFFGAPKLSGQLRLPAQSRLQKVHNVDVAMKALKGLSSVPCSGVTSRDIVDGHLEKTLKLMWHIIFETQFHSSSTVSEEKLLQEISHLTKSLQYRSSTQDKMAQKGFNFFME